MTILFAILIIAFPLTIGFALVGKKMGLSHLLIDKQSGGPSQVRVQLLLVTIAGATFYLAQTAIALSTGATKLPEIPESWLLVLGLSNGLYIGGKFASVLRVVFNALR
jgi:hypothetical protein